MWIFWPLTLCHLVLPSFRLGKVGINGFDLALEWHWCVAFSLWRFGPWYGVDMVLIGFVLSMVCCIADRASEVLKW